MSDYDQTFRQRAATLLDWTQSYFEKLEGLPVRAQVSPGDILAKLPAQAPETAGDFADVITALDGIVPGITHWQHPRFFAYFPCNVRPESLLSEIAIAAMGVNAMLWETSPAATEMEMRTTDWFRDAMGLGPHWRGMIQDTASSATFTAVVTAREMATEGRANAQGLAACPPLAFYVSDEAHSSIEKALRMAGIGSAALRRVPVDAHRAMRPDQLEAMMAADKAAGVVPAGLMITAGGTGVGAFDRAQHLIPIARAFGAYVHVDAAWAGPAMLCDEYRGLFDGVDAADSFVFNPHKWTGIGFDCSIHFIRDPARQAAAMTVKPAYLESVDGVINYSDWGPVLGRRNRGLKIWMVLSLVGLETLRQDLRNHIEWAQRLAGLIDETEGFEITTHPSLSLFSFRYKGDAETTALLEAVNDEGTTYLTKTELDGRPVIRWQLGSWRTSWPDVLKAWAAVERLAGGLL